MIISILATIGALTILAALVVVAFAIFCLTIDFPKEYGDDHFYRYHADKEFKS